MSQPVRTVVSGRGGRMANIVADAVREADALELVGRWVASSRRSVVVPCRDRTVSISPPTAETRGAVVIDLSHPEQTRELLTLAVENPFKLVIGTSGLAEEDMTVMRRVAEVAPVFYAPNFCMGIMLIGRLLEQLARRAPADWEAEVLDLHFARKADRPSATAKSLAASWAMVRGMDHPPSIAALRVGDGVSEHTVFVAGTGERIEISHRLLSRSAFVPTILDAAKFVASAEKGLFGLSDLYPL